MLKTSEKLISTLVKPTDTSDSVSFTLAVVGKWRQLSRWLVNIHVHATIQVKKKKTLNKTKKSHCFKVDLKKMQ